MINANAGNKFLQASVCPLNDGEKIHQRLDVAALRKACHGSMATVLSGDLQLQPLQTILHAMCSVQEADNVLDTLLHEYLESQGGNAITQPIYRAGHLVRCAANFLYEELEVAGSLHGEIHWNNACVNKLNHLCAKIEEFGSGHTLFALKAAVLQRAKIFYSTD